jgi:hypothetical protein
MSSDERSGAGSGAPQLEDFVPAHWHEGTLTANGVRQHFYRTGATDS